MIMIDLVIVFMVSFVGFSLHRKLKYTNELIESLRRDIKNSQKEEDVAVDLQRRLEFLQNARFSNVARRGSLK